jgi:hypothetical protein
MGQIANGGRLISLPWIKASSSPPPK